MDQLWKRGRDCSLFAVVRCTTDLENWLFTLTQVRLQQCFPLRHVSYAENQDTANQGSCCVWRFLQKKCFLKLACAAQACWSHCIRPEELMHGSMGTPTRGASSLWSSLAAISKPKVLWRLGWLISKLAGGLHSLWNTQLPLILGKTLAENTHP